MMSCCRKDRHWIAVWVVLAVLAAPAQAMVMYSGPVSIPIPASGVSLDVVSRKYGASVEHASITALGDSFLAMQDNGTIPPGNSGASGNGAYIGLGSTFYNMWQGEIIYAATGDTEETYCDVSVTAQIDATRTWNYNSSQNLVGFRFVDEDDGKLHYGWIRISLGADATSASTRTIVGYAYENTAIGNPLNPWAYAAYAGVSATATWDFSATGLTAFVQPMQHALNGFFPILEQQLPIPVNDNQEASPQPDPLTLSQKVGALWARGIAPMVYIGGTGDDVALATAQAMQSQGVPINTFAQLTAQDFWPSSADWFTASDGTNAPVYPLATPSTAYNLIFPEFQMLQAGGISSVQGLWMDYEDWPRWFSAPQEQSTPYAAQYYTDANAIASGNGVLVSPYGPTLLTDTNYGVNNPMMEYVIALEDQLFNESAYQAEVNVYGSNTFFADFNSFYSSAATPFVGAGWPVNPPNPPRPGIAANPPSYADPRVIYNAFATGAAPAGVSLNQATANIAYWFSMMEGTSTCLANNGAIGQTFPFVSAFDTTFAGMPYASYRMWTPLYKEALRHLWLRGAKGMRVFNQGPPFMGPLQSYLDLEYARSVLDEMLSFRTFLANGAPMNFGVSSTLYSGGVEWSGMSNSASSPTQWVVRTISLTGSPGVVPSIAPAGGPTFNNVPAPVGGATYLLNADGTMKRVDTRPALLYMQMEQNYADASSNGNTASPYKWPPTYSNPTFSTNVPGSTILAGTYGLYANPNDQYSLSLSGQGGSYGNGIAVPNTNGIFNASSFTVEMLINIAAGQSQDGASIISKGVNTVTGNWDWQIVYRDFAGAGMVELDIGDNSTTSAWIRTAGLPLTPGVWHHLAMTYNGSANQITLYVDGVPQPFGNHDAQVSDTGVLTFSPSQHTGDQIVIGWWNEGINANVDEVRFTPEVLDPSQFLVVGTLQ